MPPKDMAICGSGRSFRFFPPGLTATSAIPNPANPAVSALPGLVFAVASWIFFASMMEMSLPMKTGGGMQVLERRIVIFEPDFTGHHFRYLQWIVQGALDRGIAVTVITSGRHRDDARLVELLERGSLGLDAVFMDDPEIYRDGGGLPAQIIGSIKTLRALRGVVRNIAQGRQPSLVFMPYLDSLFYALALYTAPFGRIPWAGISMRPSFHLSSMGVKGPPPGFVQKLKELLFFRIAGSRFLKNLLVIDPLLADYARLRSSGRAPVSYLADPAELGGIIGKATARTELGLHADAFAILVYGAMSPRKGLAELISAVSSPQVSRDVVLLIVGSCGHVRDSLAEAPAADLRGSGRLFVIDRYVDNREESLVFSAANAVWVGYRQHYGMSGVLVQAAHYGLPAICCDEGVISWMCREHRLGEVVDVGDQQAIIGAITTIREQSGHWESNEAFCEQHATKNFVEKVLSTLDI